MAPSLCLTTLSDRLAEQRRSRRRPCRVAATCWEGPGRPAWAVIVHVSAGGFRLNTSRCYRAGEVLTVELKDAPGVPAGRTLRARVIHALEPDARRWQGYGCVLLGEEFTENELRALSRSARPATPRLAQPA